MVDREKAAKLIHQLVEDVSSGESTPKRWALCKPTDVPAQFLCGAFPAECRHCGAAVWSVVVRSQPKVAGRFSRLPPVRRLVEDDGETAHRCDREAVKRMYPERTE